MSMKPANLPGIPDVVRESDAPPELAFYGPREDKWHVEYLLAK